MVNMVACGVWQALPVAVGYRSKARQDCHAIQGLVGCLHPRRARLGLIEARPGRWPCCRRRRRIRGARASASLKPRRKAGEQLEEGAHPRRARLGLIEALSPWTARTASPAGIRGARASASLKHRLGGVVGWWPPAHRRRARLGLIEARPAAQARGRCGPHRGARASASLKRKELMALDFP